MLFEFADLPKAHVQRCGRPLPTLIKSHVAQSVGHPTCLCSLMLLGGSSGCPRAGQAQVSRLKYVVPSTRAKEHSGMDEPCISDSPKDCAHTPKNPTLMFAEVRCSQTSFEPVKPSCLHLLAYSHCCVWRGSTSVRISEPMV